MPGQRFARLSVIVILAMVVASLALPTAALAAPPPTGCTVSGSATILKFSSNAAGFTPESVTSNPASFTDPTSAGQIVGPGGLNVSTPPPLNLVASTGLATEQALDMSIATRAEADSSSTADDPTFTLPLSQLSHNFPDISLSLNDPNIEPGIGSTADSEDDAIRHTNSGSTTLTNLTLRVGAAPVTGGVGSIINLPTNPMANDQIVNDSVAGNTLTVTLNKQVNVTSTAAPWIFATTVDAIDIQASETGVFTVSFDLAESATNVDCTPLPAHGRACQITGVSLNASNQPVYAITFQDTRIIDGGIKGIAQTGGQNVSSSIPSIPTATNNPVIVQATVTGSPASVTYTVTPTMGFPFTCDPVMATIVRGNQVQTLTGIAQNEGNLRVANGAPGIAGLVLVVEPPRGVPHTIRLNDLQPGAVSNVDISPYLGSGDTNTVLLIGRGTGRDGSATVTISGS